MSNLPGSAQATQEALSGQSREEAHGCVARARVLATELALKAHSDVAWPAADRALAAAQASGDPVVHGEEEMDPRLDGGAPRNPSED